MIEVKGGGVRVDTATNEWVSLNRSGAHPIKDPFRQATREKYALRDYLRSLPNWSSLRIEPTLGHAVLFPDLDDLAPLVGTDRPLQIMGTRSNVASLKRWLGEVFDFWSSGSPTGLGAAGLKVIEQHLCTPREVRPLLSHLLDEEEQEHIRLTEDQARVLRVLGRRNRVVVSGGAGTGKTLLALEKSREFAAIGRKTLLVCYNRPLADHLRRCSTDLPHLTIASFHQLCYSFVQAANAKGGTDLFRDAEAANPGMNEYQVHYPHALAMATEMLSERYDAIVVDEAQDFGEEYWFPIELLLRNQAESILFIFCDHNQAVYRRAASFPINDEPFLLTRNCRNTRHIHEAAYAYYKGEPTEPPPLHGEAIKILDAPSRGSQAKRLHSHLVTLLDAERVKPSSIAVLVPTHLDHDVVDRRLELALRRVVEVRHLGVTRSAFLQELIEESLREGRRKNPELLTHHQVKKIPQEGTVLHGGCKHSVGSDRSRTVTYQPPERGSHELQALSNQTTDSDGAFRIAGLKHVPRNDRLIPFLTAHASEQQIRDRPALGQLKGSR